MKHCCLLSVVVVAMTSCVPEDAGDSYTFGELPLATTESGEPNLHTGADGSVFLSWIEFIDDTTDALMFSTLRDTGWSGALEIARGSDWFVNWADFPSLSTFTGRPGSLASHWLQKSADGTYDYDVHVSISKDSGRTWQPSFILHTDSISAEHGFVSMIPLENGHIFATWLDGRNTKVGDEVHEGHGHHGGGAMTLRSVEFDDNGTLFSETELDTRVCDCCQTAAALTDNGPVVAYRDRSADEVRDISIVRKVNGAWSAPESIYNDNWEIAGCPVNGPAVAAEGNHIWVSWYTAANGQGTVKLVHSADGGQTFSQPVRVDDGSPLGRVDVGIDPTGQAIVSWMEQTADTAEVRIKCVARDGEVSGVRFSMPVDPSRSSGFPQIAEVGDGWVIAWTEIGAKQRVRTALLGI